MITSNVSDDGTLLASGNKIDVQGAGAKIIVNGANTLKGNIKTADSLTTTLTINKNQSAIGTITMGNGGTLNLVLATDVTSAAFVDNSSADWGTGSLVITGAQDDEVSFGTDADGITADQLAQITMSGSQALISDTGKISVKEVAVSTFNNAGEDNLWSNASNWSSGIPNVDTAKVTVDSDLIVDSSVTVAQIKMSNATSDASVTITANNSSVLTVTGAGVTQPIQNNKKASSFVFNLPVVFDSDGGTETLRLNSGGDQSVTFSSSLTLNDELTVSGVNKLHDLNINGALLGAGNLKFGNKVQANFGASYDGSSHTGDIIVAGTGTNNDNLITSNVSDDGTLLVSGNKIDVQGAGAKIIVNGANTLKGNIKIGANDQTLTINKNQSAIGTITMGAGTLNLVLAADVTSAAFVDNSSADWGTGSLAITGAGVNEVSFGTDADGITAAQLAQITMDGFSATINSSGQINSNVAPVAVDDTLTVSEDATITSTDVIANDTDADADTLTLTAASTDGTGTVAVNADGVSVDYTPLANFNGTETITYTVSDGERTDATGTLTVTVTAVNDAPVAVADTLTVNEDAALTSTDVIANDTDVDADTLTLTAASTDGTGTVAVNADGVSVDYTPAADFNGTETITYTVSDGTLTDATGTFTITVTAVNDAPVAVADVLTVDEDAALTSTDVIANDTDVEGDTLSLTAATTAGTGTVAVNADGVSVDYTPAADFNGTETITYTVSDGTLTDATGTLTVTVTAVNDTPVASAQSVTTIEDISIEISLSGSDIDGDTLTYQVVTSPLNGTVTLTGDKATYTPSKGYFGSDSFTYKTNDGTVDSSIETISISVTSNDFDEDGILNNEDECPDTPEGTVVDYKGCPTFVLPENNNKVEITSATCIGYSDGSIGLSVVDTSYDYTITITGNADVLLTGSNNKASVTGLAKGTYTVCFKVDGEPEYEQCFDVLIEEPERISVYMDVDIDNKTSSFQLSGSNIYNIDVNGTLHKVNNDSFTTSLPTGLSIIKIYTDLDCQGIIEKEVFISEDIMYYPNPTINDVNVHISGMDKKVMISVFSEKGDLVLRKEQKVQDLSRLTEIDLSLQNTGTYIVVMEGKTVRKTFKIIKK